MMSYRIQQKKVIKLKFTILLIFKKMLILLFDSRCLRLNVSAAMLKIIAIISVLATCSFAKPTVSSTTPKKCGYDVSLSSCN